MQTNKMTSNTEKLRAFALGFAEVVGGTSENGK